MTAAVLHGLTSPDCVDLRNYLPPDEAFSIFVRALIGPGDESGEESFDFMVCSPAWLAAELMRHQVISGCTYLFMAQFDYGALERHVLKLVAHATGSDWPEVAQKLARWSHWEFEGYRNTP